MTIHSTKLLRAATGVLLLTAVLPAAAQKTTTRTLVNEPGTWKPWTFNSSASDLKILGFTVPEGRAFETRLKQIADIFQTSPIWNPPMGVDPSITGSVFGPAEYPPYTQRLKYRPIAGSILMGSFEHFEVIRTTAGKETREHNVGDETMHVILDVNLLPRGAGINSLTDDDGIIYEQPVQTADFAGFPTYGDLLVIAKNGRPVWTPVSRERFLKAFIAKHRPDAANAEQYIAEQQKQYDAFVAPAATAARQAKYKVAIDNVASKGAAAVEHERRYWERDEADTLAGLKRGASHDPKDSPVAGVIAGVRTAEDALAAMPPAERGGPACFLATEASRDPTKSGLVAMGTPKCVPLVTQNPNFFDPQLPRSAPQIIIAVQFRRLEGVWKKGQPSENKAGNLDIWTTYEVFLKADWQRLADLIGK